MNPNEMKDVIEACNVNFLLGSGLSAPFLETLGPIESLLAALDETVTDGQLKIIIRASLYKKFFDQAIAKNPQILTGASEADAVLQAYRKFLHIWNSILLRRKSTILSKEINLFTTNVDIFLEKALEDLGLEYNDGFNGRFRPTFNLSNFKKSRFKRSLHFDNKAEIPVFNLLKLHGSLSWLLGDKNQIIFSCDLKHITELAKLGALENILDIPNDATIGTLTAAAKGKVVNGSLEGFIQQYEKLLIVNPTKEKFKLTLLNQTYYEFLRLYSNELERENTVLFVLGFSFGDEHLREITLRAANSNPTLMVHVIAHTADAKTTIMNRLGMSSNVKNANIVVHAPPKDNKTADEIKYDLATINERIFGKLFEGGEQKKILEEAG